MVSIGLAILFTLGLLALMGLDRISYDEKPMDLLVRDVKVVSPSPPSPPPRRIKPQILQNAAPVKRPDLKVSKTPSQVFLKTPPLDLNLQMELPTDSSLVELDFQADLDEVVGEALSRGVGFDELDQSPRMIHSGDFSGFDELDQPPRMIHSGGYRFSFPSDLLRRGVDKGLVTLLIEIDTTGKAQIISIESASHPQLIPIAKQLVSYAYFSPNQVGGKAVTARGTWPVHIKAGP